MLAGWMEGLMSLLRWSEERVIDFNIQNHYGHTPLLLAVWKARVELAQALLRVQENGVMVVDVNTANVYGQTPLHEVLFKGLF